VRVVEEQSSGVSIRTTSASALLLGVADAEIRKLPEPGSIDPTTSA